MADARDLFHPGGKIACIVSVIRDAATRKGKFFADIEAARTFMAQQEGSTEKIGVIGFSMGGAFALLLAPGHGFAASSVNDGSAIPKDAERLLVGACPNCRQLWRERSMGKRCSGRSRARSRCIASDTHDVKEYPDAGHSFFNNHESAHFKMLEVVGIGYHVFKHGQTYGLIPRTEEANPLKFVRVKTQSEFEAKIITTEQSFKILTAMPQPKRTLTMTGLRIKDVSLASHVQRALLYPNTPHR